MKRVMCCLMLGFALVGNAQAGKKADVCHKGETIKISKKAVDAHLAHGDFLGRCEDLPTEQAVVIFRCGPGLEGGLLVTEVSLSLNVPEETPLIAAGDNCADSHANLLNNGFELSNVSAGATDEGMQTESIYTGEFITMDDPVVD